MNGKNIRNKVELTSKKEIFLVCIRWNEKAQHLNRLHKL